MEGGIKTKTLPGQGLNGVQFQKNLDISIFWPKAKIYDSCYLKQKIYPEGSALPYSM